MANAIVCWLERTFGSARTFHDHFSLPCNEFPVEEQEQLLALGSRLKEMFQRYMMHYHFHPAFYSDPDTTWWVSTLKRPCTRLCTTATGVAASTPTARWLVPSTRRSCSTRPTLLRARPEVIAQRLREQPQARPVVQEKDIEYVLQRFEEEYRDLLLRKKFALDTSNATVEQTLAESAGEIKKHLSEAERLRLLAHQNWPT